MPGRAFPQSVCVVRTNQLTLRCCPRAKKNPKNISECFARSFHCLRDWTKKKDMEDGQFQCRTDRGRNVFTRKRRIKLHTYQLPQAHAVLYSAVAAYECSPRGLKLKTDPRAFAGGGKRSAGQSPSEHPTKVYPLSSPPVLRCPCIT